MKRQEQLLLSNPLGTALTAREKNICWERCDGLAKGTWCLWRRDLSAFFKTNETDNETKPLGKWCITIQLCTSRLLRIPWLQQYSTSKHELERTGPGCRASSWGAAMRHSEHKRAGQAEAEGWYLTRLPPRAAWSPNGSSCKTSDLRSNISISILSELTARWQPGSECEQSSYRVTRGNSTVCARGKHRVSDRVRSQAASLHTEQQKPPLPWPLVFARKKFARNHIFNTWWLKLVSLVTFQLFEVNHNLPPGLKPPNSF